MLDPSVTSKPLRLGLIGATGAMGRRVLRVLGEQTRLQLAALLVRPGRQEAAQRLLAEHPEAQVECSAEAFAAAIDVALDFSAPPACSTLGPALAAAGRPYVVASTGLTAADERVLNKLSQTNAVLVAANLSLGVQVLMHLAEQAALALGDWDMEIVETHHRRKVDGPSGTALALGAALGRGAPHLTAKVGRTNQPEGRPPKELGYSVVRGGDVAGEHTVYLFGEGERLELTHRSQSADIFARGALLACRRLHASAPGRYTMQNLPLLQR